MPIESIVISFFAYYFGAGILSRLFPFINVLYALPVLIHQVIVYIRYPNTKSILIILLFPIFIFCTNWIRYNLPRMANMSILYRGFLTKFYDCELVEYSIADYTGLESLRNLIFRMPTDTSFPKFRKEDTIRQIVSIERNKIIQVKPGPKKVIPDKLVSYKITPFNNVIFVPDAPNEISGIRKFFLLHEVAHLSPHNNISLHLLSTNWIRIIFIIWFAISIEWSLLPILGLVILIIYTYFLNRNYRAINRKRRLDAEIMADYLASLSLSKDEREGLLKLFEISPRILYDRSFNDAENEARFRSLTRALQEESKGSEFSSHIKKSFETSFLDFMYPFLVGWLAFVSIAPKNIHLIFWIFITIFSLWWMLRSGNTRFYELRFISEWINMATEERQKPEMSPMLIYHRYARERQSKRIEKDK